MNDKADVRVVDAESKGDGGTDNLDTAVSPVFVNKLLFVVLDICMIGTGSDVPAAGRRNPGCKYVGVLLGKAVQDTTVFSVMSSDVVSEELERLLIGTGSSHHFISEVGSEERSVKE